jgi:UDP-N-acetylglucosamine transferase subunit ALG13
MIFVTVGTIQFDGLVQCIDQAVGRGHIRQEVFCQIGNGSYQPAHCLFFRSAPTLAPFYAKANLVVGHGGTGTTLEVLERHLRLISVANPDMQDNHQHEFLEALEAEGYLWYCRDLAGLPEMIEAVFTAPKRRMLTRTLGAAVAEDLVAWQAPPARGRRFLQRWARRRLAGVRRPNDFVSHVRMDLA